MACGCAPVHLALARPPALASDAEGRQRAQSAAKGTELQGRRDLQAVNRAPPPCRPPRGPPPRWRPECAAMPPVALAPDPYKDCKCEVKGSCKKVRFSDEVLPEDVAPAACSRIDVPAPAPGPCSGEPADADRRPSPAPAPHDCLTHRERAKDRVSVTTHGGTAPCDCPCWAAYSPDPPATLATGDIYRTCRLPKRFQYPVWFSGYNTGPKHPLYCTTASDIGRFAPTVHTVTTIYRPVDRSTSKMYVPAGPWRNRSLCNTGSIWDAYSYNNFY